MANNMHISYDLHSPGQNYERMIKTIQALGAWARVHKSYWYLSTNMTAAQVRDALWRVMDSNDSVYVVDATNNEAAWQNISPEAGTFIRSRWLAKAA